MENNEWQIVFTTGTRTVGEMEIIRRALATYVSDYENVDSTEQIAAARKTLDKINDTQYGGWVLYQP